MFAWLSSASHRGDRSASVVTNISVAASPPPVGRANDRPQRRRAMTTLAPDELALLDVQAEERRLPRSRTRRTGPVRDASRPHDVDPEQERTHDGYTADIGAPRKVAATRPTHVN